MQKRWLQFQNVLFITKWHQQEARPSHGERKLNFWKEKDFEKCNFYKDHKHFHLEGDAWQQTSLIIKISNKLLKIFSLYSYWSGAVETHEFSGRQLWDYENGKESARGTDLIRSGEATDWPILPKRIEVVGYRILMSEVLIHLSTIGDAHDFMKPKG